MTLDLASRVDRIRAYEIVLREGSPKDIVTVVDGLLLCEAWDDLVLPGEARRAWQPVIDRELGALQAEAS